MRQPVDAPPAAAVESGSDGSAASPWLLWVLVACAVAVVALGLAVNLWRPLAPEIGPLRDAQRWFDGAHLARVDAYQDPRYAVALGALLVRLGVVLAAAFSAPGRRLVRRVVDRIGDGRPGRAAAAVIVAVLVAADLAVLPLSFWSGFVHEGAFGFRTQGLAGWAGDWLVARIPAWLAAAALAAAGYTLVRRLPRAWPAVAGLSGAVLTAVLVFAAPYVLEPLWFDTEPLPPGDVRTAVAEVLGGSGEPINQLLVADASRRTRKHNAYISGLGASRRVVLYDTLVADRPADEIAMIVAHELGHQRNADLGRGTLLGGAGTVAGAFALALLVRWRARRGRQQGQADPTAAAVLLAGVLVLTLVTVPLQAAVSRRAEAAADHASLELTGDRATYLDMHLQLATENLGDPAPPTWVRLLWSTHPTSVERLTMGERWSLP